MVAVMSYIEEEVTQGLRTLSTLPETVHIQGIIEDFLIRESRVFLLWSVQVTSGSVLCSPLQGPLCIHLPMGQLSST